MNKHSRCLKKENSLIILVLIFCLSVGYATIGRTFMITGNSEIKENTWDVHFENVQIITGSVDTNKEPTIDNNNLSIDFDFMLNLPGDFYEFTVDVVNFGTIDAMIESIFMTPVLLIYLNYTIEYQNGEQITSKQLVKVGEAVRLKLRVEYRTDLSPESLPTEIKTSNLGFTIRYVQADNTGVSVVNNGLIAPVANGALDDIGTIVTIGSEQFYTIGTEGDNVKLLSMYNLYVGKKIISITDDWKVESVDLSFQTGMQSIESVGSFWDEEIPINFPWIGVTPFSSLEQNGDNYSDYNGSIVERYVNNYKSILESKFGVKVEEARLITYEELTDSETFACDEENFSCFGSLYPWIYSTSYWTKSLYDNSAVWSVFSNSLFYPITYDALFQFGVRPVIIISKSLF